MGIKLDALSHAIAYTIEEMQNRGIGDDDIFEEKGITHPTTIKALLAAVSAFIKRKTDYTPRKEELTRINDFYKAMLKVVPTLDVNIRDHGGTEDRGWYRVWAATVHDTGYDFVGDFGRDTAMFQTFYDVGAITEEQYLYQRTKNTLDFCKFKQKADGTIDVAAVIKAIKPEWLTRVFDVRIIYGLQIATQTETECLAMLKFTN
jgi:hypothetical protein